MSSAPGQSYGAKAPVWTALPPRETVTAAAYRVLRDAILGGQFAMGVRINELELAAAWRVSRTPIRDALRRLEAEGLVEAVPGHGVLVPRVTLDDADELYELREILEARAARRAAGRATPELHHRLNGLIKAFGVALKQNDPDRMAAIDAAIHAAIISSAGSRRLVRALDGVHAQTHQIRLRCMRVRTRAAKSFKEVAKLTAAIRSKDGARVETAMREHIASVRADLPTMWPGEEG